MHKTRRLMDENSVSFQMFLILLSFITLGSERQISVFKQCQSHTKMSVLRFLRAGHAQKPKFLASFISFYFGILSYLACGKKIIRLAYKNSVKLDEKSASDF